MLEMHRTRVLVASTRECPS